MSQLITSVQITFSEIFTLPDKPDWHRMASTLKRHDPDLEIKEDGVALYSGEVMFTKPSGSVDPATGKRWNPNEVSLLFMFCWMNLLIAQRNYLMLCS